MSDNQPHEVTVKVSIDKTELDEVLQKLERIRDLTKEANSLACELASEEKVINIHVEGLE